MYRPQSATCNADETLAEARYKCDYNPNLICVVKTFLILFLISCQAHHHYTHKCTNHGTYFKGTDLLSDPEIAQNCRCKRIRIEDYEKDTQWDEFHGNCK